MPRREYTQMFDMSIQQRITYMVKIRDDIDNPPCIRTTKPSVSIVHRYTRDVHALAKPDRELRLLELLHYWPLLAAAVVLHLDYEKKKTQKSAAQKAAAANKIAVAKARAVKQSDKKRAAAAAANDVNTKSAQKGGLLAVLGVHQSDEKPSQMMLTN